MIFDPAEHEPLVDEDWNENAARSFVIGVIREADDAYDKERSWPLHPEDRYGTAHKPYSGVYCGAAGTMWALTHLAQTYGIVLRHDYGDAAARTEKNYREDPAETDMVVPSYFLGTVGIMMARYAITGDRAILNRIQIEAQANVGNPAREALWGSPGTALAALLLRERNGDDRYDDELRAVQDELWSSWHPMDANASLLWEQIINERHFHFVGAAHGAVGNLAPLLRAADLLSSERRNQLLERVAALLGTYILRDGDAANWSTLGDSREGNSMQWCHGSPGVIMGLASYPANDQRVERMLVAGGEGIWQAGPLHKGPTLCHGTAGNGFALLRLASRTGDQRWRLRAERFAMHAISQVAAWRKQFNMPAFSLWTGELGVALFIDAVLRADPALLTLDTM